jgi:putative NADH-flavin reductase
MAATPHRLLLLGGTGPTGQHVAHQALALGHSLTVVARHPERLRERHANLTAVALDLTGDPEGLARILPGHDTVLSTLGRGQSLRSGHLIARSAAVLVAAMERTGPARLIFLSSFGVGDTIAQAPLHLRLVFRTLFSGLYADKAAGDAAIRASTLDWTLLYPVRLTNKPATGRYVVGPDLLPGSTGALARADVAAAMLACVDDATSIGQRLVVAPMPQG